MTTLYSTVLSPGHTYPGHPEEPGRFALLDPNFDPALEALAASPAALAEITSVHSDRMIAQVQQSSRSGPRVIDFAPTYVTRTSYEDALLAAGAAVQCTRAVVRRDADNAYAIVRPPGHHAEPDAVMGFCLFNNAAIAAQAALDEGLRKALVVDFDAHHGNGTQAAFWKDERLAYFSSHQENIYPGSGGIEDGWHAPGRIVNVPLPVYAGDQSMQQIAERVLRPMVARFQPEIIFVSAGYDAHWSDPLTTLGVSSNGYFFLSQYLVGLAQEFCKGKIVFVLEGGYDPQNVAEGVKAAFHALTGTGAKFAAGVPSPYREPDISSRIARVRAFHGFDR